MDEKNDIKGAAIMGYIKHFMSLRQRSQQEKTARINNVESVKSIPFMCGLLTIAFSAGLSPEHALRKVAPHAPEHFMKDIRLTLRSVDKGQSFGAALVHLSDNEHLRPLAYILQESYETGNECTSSLDAHHRHTMNNIRRETERAIKKLPISMLFPLVVCILPAFIMLSIVPVVAQGILSMNW